MGALGLGLPNPKLAIAWFSSVLGPEMRNTPARSLVIYYSYTSKIISCKLKFISQIYWTQIDIDQFAIGGARPAVGRIAFVCAR